MTRLVTFAAALFLFVTLADPRPAAQAGADAALVAKARGIHERVMADVEKVAKQIQAGM